MTEPVTTGADGSARGKPKCGAKTRAGGQCGRPAGWGTPTPGYGRCKLHGGASPNGKISAQRLAAADAAATFGLSVEIGPVEALRQALWRSYAEVLFYQARVAELSERGYDRLTQGTTRAVRGSKRGLDAVGSRQNRVDIETQETTAEARPNVWVTLLREAEAHHLKVAAACVQCGVQQKQLELIQMEAALMVRVLDAALSRLGYDPRSPQVRGVVQSAIAELQR